MRGERGGGGGGGDACGSVEYKPYYNIVSLSARLVAVPVRFLHFYLAPHF